ncbi:MAG: Rieske 2Fe-2S domain-containing protein [Flavobacteriaceae bacterium]|jgi:nitrite reductase/ring-hydroxylating ferredoxin subunit|nr:Rieske 2Fe-2S domain-containing protein [Flavobacteriaceae bacterium]MDG2387009.1 Rieske 2Fe-2S domain-containing protein [Flavobacteriaceae bacterium]
MNDRRNFLKTACKPIVLAALGIPVLEACSTEDDPSADVNNSNTSSTVTPSEPLIIDISDNDFESIQAVGGWLNYTSKNILLIRISESEVRVFDNRCPHQGNRDKWSYDGSTFECGYHNNTFSDSCSGSLVCYDSSLEGNTLTINF